MPIVKTPEQRGALGAWAYESRGALDLSPEQVVLLLPLKDGKPYNPATLRKAEADSEDMSVPLWRALTALYSRLAREKGIILAPVPMSVAAPTPVGDLAGLVAAINDLVAEMRQARERDQDAAAAMVRAAEALLSARQPAGVAASTEPVVPLGTGR